MNVKTFLDCSIYYHIKRCVQSYRIFISSLRLIINDYCIDKYMLISCDSGLIGCDHRLLVYDHNLIRI